MNIDEHPAIPGQMGIQSIPAVIAFRQWPAGRRLHGRGAGKPGQRMHRQVTKGVPAAGEPNIAEILQEAAAVLAEGDAAGAAQIYAEVLAHDSNQYRRARRPGEMLRSRLARVEQAKQTIAMVPRIQAQRPPR